MLIAGQAPGSKVHKTGIPFDDPSGERLREWMDIDKDTFNNESEVASLPMGFCYPGKGPSGDLPPKPPCTTTWRNPLLAQLPTITLTLAIGQYAQKWHLPESKSTLTDTVKNWDAYNNLMPLPQPSPRNNIWLKRNPWFAMERLPELKRQVRHTLAH